MAKSYPPQTNNEYPFLKGGGEMGRLTRAYNWAATPVGAPANWPQSLRTTLSILLNSKFPMFLWWGTQHICFYNDAYRPSLGQNGKHPSILGMPAVDAWPEIWDIIKPQIDQVLTGGEATWAENQLIPIYRNGQLEDVYWTFSYSPVSDESGKPAGVLVTCTETTESVLNQQRLEENNKHLRMAIEAESLAQKKVKENERNLRLIILQAPVAIAIFRGPEYVVEIVNPRALELWGRQSVEVFRKPILEAMPELKDQGIKQLLDHVYQTGEPFSATELPVELLRDGKMATAYINFVYEPLYDLDGDINGLITIGTEVTEQVSTRNNIEKSERRLNSMVTTTPIGMSILRGRELVVEMVNQPILDLWNHSRDEVIGKKLLDIFPDLTKQAFPQLLDSVFATGKAIKVSETAADIISPHGNKHIYVDFSYDPLFDENGQVEAIMATVVDITQIVLSRKALENSEAEQQATNEELSSINEELSSANEELMSTNEELSQTQDDLQRLVYELAASDARFRFLVQGAPVAIGVFQGRNLIVEPANNLMLNIWGKSQTILGKPLAQALPELEGQPFLQILDDVYTSGKPYYGSEAMVRLEYNGELKERYFDFIYQPLNDGSTDSNTIMAVATDVTEQVYSKMELKRAEEALRFSIEAANAATWYLDAETREFIPSPRLKELFGFNPELDVSYDDIIDSIPGEYQDKIHAAIEIAVLTGESYSMEHPTVDYYGKKHWIRGIGKLYPAAGSRKAHFSGLVIDITEQKHDEIRKNDFIGMVSHELKTPLTSLSAIVQVLGAKLKTNPDAFIAGAMDKANMQIKKMSTMINGFLNISRLESGKILINKHDFDLDELIREMIEETNITTTSHEITLAACQPITIHADRDKIGSVISNLLSNAVKYSPKGKNIEVHCEKTGGNIKVSVKDEGMGIKPQDIDKLFDRYYRVQSPHTTHISGFGIGLYLSAEIIKRHNGKIWVESKSGIGSTFYFTLPLKG